MQINNPLQMNDWKIGRFLRLVISIQFALWGAIGLDAIGLQIPILRQFVGFIYLTFIPGILVLRILKLHKLGDVDTFLYTVGMSITVLMFIGLFINTFYRFVGISRPISLMPLIVTISAVVLILCVICYIIDKGYSAPSFINIKDLLSVPALFLFLIPFLAVFGTYLVNFHQNNILLMLMMAVISVIVILMGFDKFITQKFYPLTIAVITIALLLHNSLISMFIWGWDINLEFYISHGVIANSLWDSSALSSLNSMLSIVMLAPIFSIIANMNLEWVFKIIYPFLFSLVPLGLYSVFQKQTNDKIAFLGCFFFVSINTFYVEMIALARQEVAELFYILLIMLMINKDMNKTSRSFLTIIFGISLIVSHYGLSYIYMAFLISTWLILTLASNSDIQNLAKNFYSKFSRNKKHKLDYNLSIVLINDITITTTYVGLFIVFTLTWYLYTSNSSSFNNIVHIGDQIAEKIYTDFLNPEAVQGLKILTTETYTPLRDINKIINYINQIFIIIGVVVLLFKSSNMKFEKEYEVFSVLNLMILFASISLPFFASSLNMTRIYQITLFFLAPLIVIGAMSIFREISNKVRVAWTTKSVRWSLKVLSIYLVIFFLFQIGFIFQIAEGYSGSISLSQEGVKKYGSINNKIGFYNSIIPEQDVSSSRWLSNNANNTYKIYSDDSVTGIKNNALVSAGLIDYNRISVLTNNTFKTSDKSYVFLRYVNIVENIMSYRVPGTLIKKGGWYNTNEIYIFIENKNKIYSNGGSIIYTS